MADRVLIGATDNGLVRATLSVADRVTAETCLPHVRPRCLAADPLNCERAYAGTPGGALRSDDQGRSWRPAGLVGRTVTTIAASPLQRGLVYAGVKPAGIFVSADAGDHWDELTAFQHIRGRRLWFSPAEKPYVAYVQAIALSPTDASRIVAGVEFGATVVSSDGGRSWSNHLRGSLRDCHNLCFHTLDGNWVYAAGGTGGGAAFSRDGGLTWTQAAKGLDRHYGWAVAADPLDPAIWYVSVAPGPGPAHSGGAARACIFRHQGGAWQRLGGGLPQPLAHMPYALITSPGVGGALFAGLSNGELWHSSDYGDNWSRLRPALGAPRRALIML